MIYLTKAQLSDRYGGSFPSLNNRFNADESSSHKNAAFIYEFGYLQGRCIYAIIQKNQGNNIALLEAAALMAINGPGSWKLVTSLDPQNDSAALQKMSADPVINLGYSYAPVAQDAFYSTGLFASHQLNHRQLVVYHPIWQADLSQVESSPL